MRAPQPVGLSRGAEKPVINALNARQGELKRAILASGGAFKSLGVFSLAINILMLAGPLFMLQVYDRVMTSGSIPTLVTLSLLTAGIYAIIGLLELARSRIIVRVGIELDRRIGERVFQASLRRSIQAQGSSLMALRELDTLRQFIAGPGPLTFFDAPWTPVYLAVIFAVHWALGVSAIVGAGLLVAIAWASESSTPTCSSTLPTAILRTTPPRWRCCSGSARTRRRGISRGTSSTSSCGSSRIPRSCAKPWSVERAWTFIDALLAAPSLGMLIHTERHSAVASSIWKDLPHLSGNLVHDAHTAVLMKEHGIRRIYTRDTDFHRFPFLEPIDPVAA